MQDAQQPFASAFPAALQALFQRPFTPSHVPTPLPCPISRGPSPIHLRVLSDVRSQPDLSCRVYSSRGRGRFQPRYRRYFSGRYRPATLHLPHPHPRCSDHLCSSCCGLLCLYKLQLVGPCRRLSLHTCSMHQFPARYYPFSEVAWLSPLPLTSFGIHAAAGKGLVLTNELLKYCNESG